MGNRTKFFIYGIEYLVTNPTREDRGLSWEQYSSLEHIDVLRNKLIVGIRPRRSGLI
jgi:hypothetical protein